MSALVGDLGRVGDAGRVADRWPIVRAVVGDMFRAVVRAGDLRRQIRAT